MRYVALRALVGARLLLLFVRLRWLFIWCRFTFVALFPLLERIALFGCYVCRAPAVCCLRFSWTRSGLTVGLRTRLHGWIRTHHVVLPLPHAVVVAVTHVVTVGYFYVCRLRLRGLVCVAALQPQLFDLRWITLFCCLFGRLLRCVYRWTLPSYAQLRLQLVCLPVYVVCVVDCVCCRCTLR